MRLEPVATPRQLRDGGVYLLTGGLGGIALSLARKIARTVKAPRLALVSRNRLPERERWTPGSPDTRPAIRSRLYFLTLRDIEDAGADVLILSADVPPRGHGRRHRRD